MNILLNSSSTNRQYPVGQYNFPNMSKDSAGDDLYRLNKVCSPNSRVLHPNIEWEENHFHYSNEIT